MVWIPSAAPCKHRALLFACFGSIVQVYEEENVMASDLVGNLVNELKNRFLHLREEDRKNMVDWAIVFAHAAEVTQRGVKICADDRVPDGRSYRDVVRAVHRLAHERYGKGPGRDEGAVLDHLDHVFGHGLDADPRDVIEGVTFPGETLGDIALDWVAAARTPHFNTVRDLPLLMETLTRASVDGTGVLDPSERLEDGRRIRRIVLELGQDVIHGMPFDDDEKAVVLALSGLWQGQTVAPVAALETACQGGNTIGGHLDAWQHAHAQGGPRP